MRTLNDYYYQDSQRISPFTTYTTDPIIPLDMGTYNRISVIGRRILLSHPKPIHLIIRNDDFKHTGPLLLMLSVSWYSIPQGRRHMIALAICPAAGMPLLTIMEGERFHDK